MEGFGTLGVKGPKGKEKNEELLLQIAGAVWGLAGALAPAPRAAAGRRRSPDAASPGGQDGAHAVFRLWLLHSG